MSNLVNWGWQPRNLCYVNSHRTQINNTPTLITTPGLRACVRRALIQLQRRQRQCELPKKVDVVEGLRLA